MRRVVVVLAGLLSVLAACGGSDADGGRGGSITVFAAASLTEAFEDIAAAFERSHAGVDVELVLAGSSSLREQILQGAPADVFASADRSTMGELVDAGAVGEPRPFARNRLAIAVPADNPADIATLDDLARPDPLVGLCAEPVPCGAAARAVLSSAGVEASIDTEEPDVRALLTKIEAGELDAGIVYVTDVRSAGHAVEGIAIPPEHDVAVTYPIATVRESEEPVLAREFVEFASGADGGAILREHGFGAP